MSKAFWNFVQSWLYNIFTSTLSTGWLWNPTNTCSKEVHDTSQGSLVVSKWCSFYFHAQHPGCVNSKWTWTHGRVLVSKLDMIRCILDVLLSWGSRKWPTKPDLKSMAQYFPDFYGAELNCLTAPTQFTVHTYSYLVSLTFSSSKKEVVAISFIFMIWYVPVTYIANTFNSEAERQLSNTKVTEHTFSFCYSHSLGDRKMLPN